MTSVNRAMRLLPRGYLLVAAAVALAMVPAWIVIVVHGGAQ